MRFYNLRSSSGTGLFKFALEAIVVRKISHCTWVNLVTKSVVYKSNWKDEWSFEILTSLYTWLRDAWWWFVGGKINHFNNKHFSDFISKLPRTSIVWLLVRLSFCLHCWNKMSSTCETNWWNQSFWNKFCETPPHWVDAYFHSRSVK